MVRRRWERRRGWSAGSRVLIAPKSWSSPPLLPPSPPPPDAMAGSVCLQPSRSVTEGPQAVKAVEAAVQVDDRGAAGGEVWRTRRRKESAEQNRLAADIGRSGTPDLTAGARRSSSQSGGPRTDGGSTSPEIKAEDIRTGTRLTSPRPPLGRGGGHQATGIWRLASGGIWHLVASDDWHLAASGSGGI